MSLELSGCNPLVVAKTEIFHNGINLYGKDVDNAVFDVRIPMEDFCFLIEYFLRNTDLTSTPSDPRLALIDKIKNAKIIEGYNPGGRRIEL
jgi:hypothetical protein